MILPIQIDAPEAGLQEGLPADMASLSIAGATPFHASWEGNRLLLQLISGGGFIIWGSHYCSPSPGLFNFELKVPLLTLQLAHSGTFEWQLPGSKYLFKTRQMDLLHLPAGKYCVRACDREITTLNLLLTYPFLQSFHEYYPVLTAFLKDAARGRVSRLSPVPLTVSRTLGKRMQRLLHSPFQQALRKMYFDAQVMEIIIEVLELATGHITPAPPIRPEEMERIEAIRRLLDEQPHKRVTIAQLARKAHMNVIKLKQGFRLLTGTSIFGYHLGQRMERARELLLNTELTLDLIADEAGYDHLSSFIAAFKAIHGMTPATYRKSRRK